MKTSNPDVTQLSLFAAEDIPSPPPPTARTGGSLNPIVFRDYESYVAKFADMPKTTDDTFTPRDVYDAVVRYVGSVCDLSDKVILRPFFPGGDYEHSDYPPNGIVIDNPPFSMFTAICGFYTLHHIPFFIFGPALTISSCCKYCTAVIVGRAITFENGAQVPCSFASNIFADTMIMTAPQLDNLLAACPSQNRKKNLPKYDYPEEVLSVSDMQTISRGGIEFAVSRSECDIIRKLDNHPQRGGLFGDRFLLSAAKAAAKTAAKAAAKTAAKAAAKTAAKAAAKAAALNAIHIALSAREQRIVDKLSNTLSTQ